MVGLILFAATILLLRDFRVLERYRYTIALAGLLLLLLPRVPGIGQQVNGAYLGVKLGPVAFQPAEFGKIAIIVFLAAYLRDTRQVLVQGRDACWADHDPAAQAPRAAARGLGRGDVHARLHPRPRLVADVLRRLPGAALRGHQPALVRGDRDRACSPSARGSSPPRSATCRTASTSGWTRSSPQWVEKEGYQLAQSVFAQADGGLFGTGFGASLLRGPGGESLIPAPQTDLIYSVIVNEVGLVGALRAAARLPAAGRARLQDRDDLAPTRSPSCWPPGLTAVLALQVFVIVGGVTRVIPLTGVTLPFVSYGGSSILANFVLVALLLLVSDRARRPAGRAGEAGAAVNGVDLPPVRARARAVRAARGVHVALDGVRGRGAARQRQQPPRAARRAADQARPDPRGRRQGAGPQPVAARQALRPPLPDRPAVRPRRRLHVDRPRPLRDRGLLQRPADRPRDGRGRRRGAPARARRRWATTCARRCRSRPRSRHGRARGAPAARRRRRDGAQDGRREGAGEPSPASTPTPTTAAPTATSPPRTASRRARR